MPLCIAVPSLAARSAADKCCSLGACKPHVCESCVMSKHKLPPWLKPKTAPREIDVGVGWYTESDWALVKAAATDPERFESTYEVWVQMAEESLLNFLAAGIVARKEYINANELLAWCLAHGKKNNAGARAQFVSERGAKRHESGA